jgi:hypothetical protein
MKRIAFASSLTFALFSVVACGSSGSEFGDGSKGGHVPSAGPQNGGDAFGEIGPTGTNSACVTDVADAALAPTNLVFMFDKSGSMGDPSQGGDMSTRWTPATTGIKEFFADPYSSTLQASLQFFPQGDQNSGTEADSIAQECNFAYANPMVPMSPASSPAFPAAIDSMTPSGGTPTVPALSGAIQYAATVKAAHPNDKTAVVLVTDGMPGYYYQNTFQPGCASNDVATAANIAKTGFTDTGVPTYVIGVGPKLDNLNEIASAGGTNAAMMVDTSNPASVKSTIMAALDTIRHQTVACEFQIPAAPDGKELNPFAVNVVLKNADGSQKVLSYSKECADADGWRYDNPDAPSRIILCDQACGDARASSSGNVTLAFGCKTQVAVQ